MSEFEVFLLFSSVFLCFYCLRFFHKLWISPIRLQAKMMSQGMRGPSYKFPYGNTKQISQMRSQFSHKPMDISHHEHPLFPRLHPHVYAWTKVYGRNFICWDGSKCQLFVTEPELSKEILMNREGAFPKMDMAGCLKKLVGEALTTNEGVKWAKVRKLADRSFHAESLKGMVPEMSSSVAMMLEKWGNYEGREIDVFQEFRVLTNEVISRTAFGSSYMDGKLIFEMKEKLTALAAKNLFKLRFPGISLLVRSDDEVEAGRIDLRLNDLIMEKVRERERDGELGCDYLGQLIRISHESDVEKMITMQQLVDEVKAIYGAGNRTTTSLLGWCVLLLATHTQWQDKAREEVKETFGGNTPDAGGISRLKIMNMIINECLRLYPPALSLTRKVAKETKLGQLCLFPNTNIFISVLALHHNPQIWGDDVLLFKPERFAQGVIKATNNNTAAFLPFGMGARTCVGIEFTTTEAKIALSMILHNYKFVLSPNYVHCPIEDIILVPRNGIQVILEKI
ncbi:cytochrome P450 CYP749A22-like [Salvia hispanica]|uniref:cytochrome P450 CYP749A22-like n=1 Tax=Salvia hispanica TaxID=49212 RepID=UPI002009B929|nr:cytochrome P450 CYP749A22-like [Salvia hispanica]